MHVQKSGPGVRRGGALCRHVTPVANVLLKPHAISKKGKLGNKVKFSNRVTKWCNVLSMEGVTVYGHPLECRVTFWRGVLHIV